MANDVNVKKVFQKLKCNNNKADTTVMADKVADGINRAATVVVMEADMVVDTEADMAADTVVDRVGEANNRADMAAEEDGKEAIKADMEDTKVVDGTKEAVEADIKEAAVAATASGTAITTVVVAAAVVVVVAAEVAVAAGVEVKNLPRTRIID